MREIADQGDGRGPQSGIRPPQPVVYQRVGGLIELPALLRELGCEPEDVISGTGIDPQALSHADHKIPYAQAARLLHAGARHTGCAHFGLLAGQRWNLSHMGVLGEAMKASRTVGAALQTFATFQHRNSDAAAAFLLEQSDQMSLGYVVYRKDIDHLEFAYDVAMAFAWNLLRELCGAGWQASEAIFARAQPADPLPYRQHFRVPLRFDQDHCAVRFPMRWLERPVAATDIVRPGARQDLAADRAEPDLVHRTHRYLRLLLLEGKCSGDELAKKVSLHRRTLNRRLRDQGTTFQQILDEVRFEVARQMLRNTEMAIPDIAAALCYSEVSAFTHAFRRWTGTSPHRWRSAAPRA